MSSYEEYESKESERLAKIGRMFQLADDVGSGKDKNLMTGEMWFKTWQEALDFKDFCNENGLPVCLIEADAKPVSWVGENYRVFPE